MGSIVVVVVIMVMIVVMGFGRLARPLLGCAGPSHRGSGIAPDHRAQRARSHHHTGPPPLFAANPNHRIFLVQSTFRTGRMTVHPGWGQEPFPRDFTRGGPLCRGVIPRGVLPSGRAALTPRPRGTVQRGDGERPPPPRCMSTPCLTAPLPVCSAAGLLRRKSTGLPTDFAADTPRGYFATATAGSPGAAVKVSRPLASSAFQTRTSPSQLPVTTRFDAGWKATL